MSENLAEELREANKANKRVTIKVSEVKQIIKKGKESYGSKVTFRMPAHKKPTLTLKEHELAEYKSRFFKS